MSSLRKQLDFPDNGRFIFAQEKIYSENTGPYSSQNEEICMQRNVKMKNVCMPVVEVSQGNSIGIY